MPPTEGTGQDARLGALTHDAFLGGRLNLWQPRRGHRAGFEAVLLGASVKAGAGESLFDLGAGVGTAGLCAATRLDGLSLTLVERDAGLAEIAARNAVDMRAKARIVCADATASPATLAGYGLGAESADHVVCNPPFRKAEAGTASPDRLKAAAHREAAQGALRWFRTALMLARHGGSLAFMLSPDLLPRFLGWSEGRIGALRVLPIAHRPGSPASRVLVTGLRARRTPPTILPFLTLSEEDGRPSARADAVLRQGGALLD